MSNKPKLKKKQQNSPTNRGKQSSPTAGRIAAGIGGVVAIVIVGVIAFSQPAATGVPDGTESIAVDAPTHVEGDIHEEGEVPAGGAHSAAWQNCGFYDTPIRSENAVHSLEHGAVWVTYEPGLSGDQISQLRNLMRPLDKILISPVDGQESPIIATAWANQLEVDRTDDPRLEQFINEFEGSLDAPEPGALCSGGIGDPIG